MSRFRSKRSPTTLPGVTSRPYTTDVRHHVYLSPGMFGFGKLGSYNYFAHVQRELVARFAAAGHDMVAHVIEELPTASIRRRATRLAEIITQTSGTDEPIHLLGHSTGGLDARLVASPATRSIADAQRAWLPRLRSVTTMNTPHYGTPLASFFATSNGQHALAALSVLTMTGLTLGARPLAVASLLLGVLRGADSAIPLRIKLVDRSVSSMVGIVDDVRSPEVKTFIAAIEEDQGSMLQLSPEAMDLVVAGFPDRDGVTYQSTVSMTPGVTTRSILGSVTHPWRAMSMTVFSALRKLTANVDLRYPCAASDTPDAALAALFAKTRVAAPTLEDSDGIVPIHSQLWGTVVWAGLGDHLDVLGHYADSRDDDALVDVPAEARHRDWLASGSAFSDRDFALLMDAIANGMLDDRGVRLPHGQDGADHGRESRHRTAGRTGAGE